MPAPFRFVIVDVFRLTGRGMAVVGVGPSEGEFISGETVEVVREGAVILSSEASLELHARPGMVALVLPAFDADVRPGDEWRALTSA
jgi:hypothetical protein